MTKIARPAVARSGGATPPHGGMVPRPAATNPQPAGVLRAGILVPPCETSPAGLPSGRGLFWTREELERLAALRAEGRTRAECAALLGRSLYGIHHAVRQYRLKRTRNKKWTVAELRTLVRLKIARHTVAHIAAQVGRTPRSTSRKWQEVSRRLPPGIVAEIRHDMIRRGGARAKDRA